MKPITPKEIRLGNIIDKYGKPIVVDLGILRKIDNGSVIYKPIPLTEEWLLKFGFDNIKGCNFTSNKQYHNNRINEGAYFIQKVGDAFSNWYLYHKDKRITSNIKYVHQLQNLYFCLCGEELEIKNTL